MPDEFPAYTKINSLWKRDGKGHIIEGEWATPELKALRYCDWLWTEKVDGTNIRLGYESDPQFRGNEHAYIWGRTDNAQTPPHLLKELVELQKRIPYEEVFPDLFPGSTVTLYGEGYGPKIQKGGGLYRDTPGFVLFDVRVGSFWLTYDNVVDVGGKLGLDVVPQRNVCSLVGAWSMLDPGSPDDTPDDIQKSERWPNSVMEGWVGRPIVNLFDNKGHRILAKIKLKDYDGLR